MIPFLLNAVGSTISGGLNVALVSGPATGPITGPIVVDDAAVTIANADDTSITTVAVDETAIP